MKPNLSRTGEPLFIGNPNSLYLFGFYIMAQLIKSSPA